jgi:hypothetical protein
VAPTSTPPYLTLVGPPKKRASGAIVMVMVLSPTL